MKSIRTLVIAGLGLAIMVAPADARDFYIKPMQPGPVMGTALAAVSLKANGVGAGKSKRLVTITTDTTTTTTDTTTTPDTTTTTPDTTTTTPDTTATDTTTTTTDAKWITVGDTGSTTTTTTTTSGSATTTSGSTTQTSTAAPDPNAQVFASVNTALASGQVSGGDRLFLMDGYHGALTIRDIKFSSPVLIAPVPGQDAHFDRITLRNSSNFVFDGVKVWPMGATPGKAPVVRTYGDTSDITFRNVDIRAVQDAANYMSWSLQDWLDNYRPGVMLDGDHNSVLNSRLTGIQHGILAQGKNSLVQANIIDGFSGDGMRALGDNTVVRGNKVQNCFDIDANHDDGLQSYSIGPTGKTGTGVVYNVTVEDNKILEWASPVAHPLHCRLQGIGMFDGMFDGFAIRNNLIVTSAYHGLTMMGARNSTIVNNTVVSAGGKTDNYPWVSVSPHKNGTPSQNVVAANNYAMQVKVKNDPVNNTVAAGNALIGNPLTAFASFSGMDFNLSASSKAADAGSSAYAPVDDIAGNQRPKGAGPDAGAFETR